MTGLTTSAWSSFQMSLKYLSTIRSHCGGKGEGGWSNWTSSVHTEGAKHAMHWIGRLFVYTRAGSAKRNVQGCGVVWQCTSCQRERRKFRPNGLTKKWDEPHECEAQSHHRGRDYHWSNQLVHIQKDSQRSIGVAGTKEGDAKEKSTPKVDEKQADIFA